MQPSIVRTIALSVALVALVTQGAGSFDRSSATVSLRLRATTPRFEAQEGEGPLAVSIDGFGTSSRPGEPALPVKVILVAIPEGSEPELRILSARYEILEGLDLVPVPSASVGHRVANARRAVGRSNPREDASGNRAHGAVSRGPIKERRREPRIYGSDRFFPADPVRLGSIGHLRQQRFVEVIFTPLLYNPRGQRARFYREVQAEVRFSMPGGGIPVEAFAPDPYFEKTYRLSLVNYEQGKLFRAGAREAPEPSGAPEPVDAQPLASVTAAPEVKTAAAMADGAGAPSYKLSVSEPGVYRLDHAYLTTHAADLLSLDPRTYVVEAEGVEIPISIRNALTGGSGEADGSFDAEDFIEFYGRPRTEAPTVLNYDYESIFPDIFQANDFTDTQVYWLTSVEPAGSHLRILATSGAPGSPGYPQAGDFEEIVVWDENDILLPLGDVDPYFSLPSLLADSADAQRDIEVPLPGLASGTGPAEVTLRLRGGTSLTVDPDHRTVSWVNADVGGGVDFTWDGEIIHEETFAVSQSILTDPSTVHLQAPGDPGVAVDEQFIDTLTIRYRRTFAALAEELTFSYPNQDARFVVTGLGAVAPVIYEVGRSLPGSGESDPIMITGAAASGAPTSIYTFEVPYDPDPGAGATRTFVVVGPGAIREPDDVVQAADPLLKVAGNSADMVVIAARDAVDTSPGGSLDLLLAHRLATQGLTSTVVFIDQVYDEFSYGLRDANAIRSFLDFAFDNWTGPGGTDPPPSFVLLVGDATADYKNTLGRSDWIDQVPTPIMFQISDIFGYYSSDNYLAAFRGDDQIPDVHLGRISTRTATASALVFEKIRLHELSAPGGLWKGRAVLSAGDEKHAGEAEQFEAINDAAEANHFSTPPFSAPSPPLYYNQPPWNADDPAGFNAALTAELEAGAVIFTYAGHGNFNTFGLDGFFTTTDAEALTNGLKLPFMMNFNCLSGGFHFLLESGSLGEGIVNNPDGGAIAALAPAGLSFSFVGEVIAEEVLEDLFGVTQERVLGVATAGMRAVLWNRGSITDAQSYTFLGDPASVLATPAPLPPVALAAAAGNGEVTLSWTAPPGPTHEIRFHRAPLDPAGPYAVVTCDPITATSCSDTTVVNGTRYYYYAVSVDPDGFVGSPSNFNSDCDLGPDCVTAFPFNPTPPATPTGVSAVNTGAGGRILVEWDPNPEDDIDFYTVHYSTASGVYTDSATAPGTATSLELAGLTDGIEQFCAVSATNTSGFESPLSAEVSAVPSLLLGMAPPATITDLMLSASGSDLVLDWSRPLVDIYNRPTTVVGYRVYRGAAPNFQVSASSLLATIDGGDNTTFTDVGALGTPTAYYLVTALDEAGMASGAGRQLPTGITDLSLTYLSGDTVRLQWSAVTTDVTGAPTDIDRYQVHVSAVPVGRGGLGPSTLLLDNVTSVSVDLSLPTSQNFISVIAVDSRGNLSPF